MISMGGAALIVSPDWLRQSAVRVTNVLYVVIPVVLIVLFSFICVL